MSPPSRAPALLAPGAPSSSAASARLPGRDQPLPAVDERLVAPETPFEIVDGKVVEVMGSHEPHAAATSQLAYVLGASVSEGFRVAVDMLTRADRFSDVAPDASVFPVERDPATGGRQLEQLVFEVRDTQALSEVTRKAELLSARGVRRIFCLEVEASRLLEWKGGGWEALLPDGSIDDPCFVRPLSVRALAEAAEADNAVALALLAKNNPMIERAVAAGREEGLQKGLRKGLRDGRAEGLRDGRAAGLREGEEKRLREAIVDLCEVLGIELDDARRNHLERLELDGLEALRKQLKQQRRWG